MFDQLILGKGSAIDVARDLFIFQMFTGLSYSDMQAHAVMPDAPSGFSELHAYLPLPPSSSPTFQRHNRSAGIRSLPSNLSRTQSCSATR